VAGCIEDSWAVLEWTRANAARLNIDPTRIVIAGNLNLNLNRNLNIDPTRIIIAGDSAGGLLATALGTGLGADVLR
jgi:acetyl esterase/lipase